MKDLHAVLSTLVNQRNEAQKSFAATERRLLRLKIHIQRVEVEISEYANRLARLK
jgi:hypothetical protein